MLIRDKKDFKKCLQYDMFSVSDRKCEYGTR